MFNYYQHRASPDHEASDVGYEEFVHLIGFFLGWGLFEIFFVSFGFHPFKEAGLEVFQIIRKPSIIFKGQHIASSLVAFTKINDVYISVDIARMI